MARLKLTDWWDKLFAIGIALKGLDGVIELLGGFALLFVGPAQINHWAFLFTRSELSEDPNDFIANHILAAAAKLTGNIVLFTAVYLIVHGLVKVILVGALLLNQTWAYPWMIGVLVLFIVYQLYQLAVKWSWGLLALTVFDAFIVVLTWHEYKRHRKRHTAAPGPRRETAPAPRVRGRVPMLEGPARELDRRVWTDAQRPIESEGLNMAAWQETLHLWGPAWAAVRGLDGAWDGAAVAVDGGETVLAWPGDIPATGAVTVVTDQPGDAGAAAAGQGLAAAGELVLLTARTQDLDMVPGLPPNANLAEAPLEMYDAVEVSLFDRPVAGGRIKVGDGLAVLGGLHVDPGHDDIAAQIEAAMIASLGEEAFLHGADTLYLVADADQAARFAGTGWTEAARLLNFIRPHLPA
ncbi:DUF2127 domain-containing protein [Specibacter cremeus]|uniref:DUF2127 domain-containing protein n=1 Tax=Specibacter cremeus TaxID=1629051 RepID=UPI000F7AB4E5|nr:DUF2127 domain-containing protein [Specibacter cremeus]